MKTKIGIADAHGIESYIDKTDTTVRQMNMFALRASLNRQRHSIAYEIDINDDDDKIINKLLGKQKYIEALNKLKNVAIDVRVVAGMGDVNASWGLIPNPSLDPYN